MRLTASNLKVKYSGQYDVISEMTGHSNSKLSEGMIWHLENKVPLHENVYRVGSKNYFRLLNEARILYKMGLLEITSALDRWLIKTDIGKTGLYEGKRVMLDVPFVINESSDRMGLINEAEYDGRDVELNKPQRSSGPKKYQVYVKNEKGNVIKVNFGDKKGGLTAKIKDPDARKAFADRHDCKNKKDKTSPGYWSCNLPRYAKLLGMGDNMNTYW